MDVLQVIVPVRLFESYTKSTNEFICVLCAFLWLIKGYNFRHFLEISLKCAKNLPYS